jgi:predicted MarR family transcription regulator
MNLRQVSPANKYLESIHAAQTELLKCRISRDEFVTILGKVDHDARMDTDISEVEYGLIRAVYEIANGE